MSGRSHMKALSYILIRIMAIFYFASSLFYIESIIYAVMAAYSNSAGDTGTVINWAVVFIPVLKLLTSIILWVFAKRISDAVLKGFEGTMEEKFDFGMRWY